MHFLLRCIFFQLVNGCGPNRMKYVCEEGKRSECILYIRLAWYAFWMFDYNKNQSNLRVKKLDLNRLNRLQLFTIYSTITRRYTLRDQTQVPFFQGYSNKKGTDRTKLEKNANQIATTTDARFERYAFLYSAIYTVEMHVCVCASTVVICDTSAAIPTKLRRKITTP